YLGSRGKSPRRGARRAITSADWDLCVRSDSRGDQKGVEPARTILCKRSRGAYAARLLPCAHRRRNPRIYLYASSRRPTRRRGADLLQASDQEFFQAAMGRWEPNRVPGGWRTRAQPDIINAKIQLASTQRSVEPKKGGFNLAVTSRSTSRT